MTHTSSTLAFVFPGQGSQQLGMLSALASQFPIIEQTFTEGSEAIKKDLWKLAQQGPENELNDTVNTQPLLLTAGVAVWRVWQNKAGVLPRLLAGHSLGEYTALVCSGALKFAEAVQLVAERGHFMQAAVPAGQGAMAAVIGLEDALLEEACREGAQGEVVACVNYNSPGQTVIAGAKEAVARASALAKEKGAKKVILLPVSVPSHCALMKEAANLFKQELIKINMVAPTISIIHNVNVSSSLQVNEIRQYLVEQLYSPVQWVKTIQHFKEQGITTVVECGPGKVLAGLIKRIDSSLRTFNIESVADLDLALTSME